MSTEKNLGLVVEAIMNADLQVTHVEVEPTGGAIRFRWGPDGHTFRVATNFHCDVVEDGGLVSGGIAHLMGKLLAASKPTRGEK